MYMKQYINLFDLGQEDLNGLDLNRWDFGDEAEYSRGSGGRGAPPIEHAGALPSHDHFEILKIQLELNCIWLLEGDTEMPIERQQLFHSNEIPTKMKNSQLHVIGNVILHVFDDSDKFNDLEQALAKIADDNEDKIMIKSLIEGGINKELFYCGKLKYHHTKAV